MVRIRHSSHVSTCTREYFQIVIGVPLGYWGDELRYIAVPVWKEMSEADMKEGVTTAFNEMGAPHQFESCGAQEIIERWGPVILMAAKGLSEDRGEDDVNDVFFYLAIMDNSR